MFNVDVSIKTNVGYLEKYFFVNIVVMLGFFPFLL